MNKRDDLADKNRKMNNINFVAGNRIKKLQKKLIYVENLKTIWAIKDRIKELKHKILINEQQVRYNLLVMITGHDKRI